MFSQKHAYTAITVMVDTLTSEQYEEDDLSGIPGLVEVIQLQQAKGAQEVSRAIRKKLKYGSVHRQLRALTLLDGLIRNAGVMFQRSFADEMLLTRLRECATSDLSDPLVRNKCKVLFRSWAKEYENTAGLTQVLSLSTLPQRKQALAQNKSRVLRETEQNPFDADEDKEDETPPTPASQSSRSIISKSSTPVSPTATKKSAKNKKSGKKAKPFNLEAEKDVMKTCIAEASVTSTNLLNALRLINREREQISENQEAVRLFDACKLLRRKILRYIQHVQSEQWVGALLDANDRLVTSLLTFEQLDRSIDADSDSDDDLAEQAHLYNMATMKEKEKDTTQQLAGLSINRSPVQEQRPPPPPRPAQAPDQNEDEVEDDDEDDPFADRNAVNTPAVEKSEPRWTNV